ncbi:MAG: hypothetical protein IKU26_05050 [Clostridia bacterium]|nr:hypothetical protein [Clostridia bacterium]
MTSYETYVFLLCLIVFVMLTTLSVVSIAIIARLTIRLIRAGAEDAQLAAENTRTGKATRIGCGIQCTFSVLVCLLFAVLFSLSIYTWCVQESFSEHVPTYRVVLSGSMATAHEKNTYLQENHLTDRLQVYDMAAFTRVPPQEELSLYDIVIYEYEDTLICHRIVEIKEDKLGVYYILQGDAVERADRCAVRYEQIRAIYTGTRIPNVGSFVLFLRSPAGWMCMILLIVGMIAAPLVDRRLEQERNQRRILLGIQGGERDA